MQRRIQLLGASLPSAETLVTTLGSKVHPAPARSPRHAVAAASDGSVFTTVVVPIAAAIIGALLALLWDGFRRRREEGRARRRLINAVLAELKQIVRFSLERSAGDGQVLFLPPLPGVAWRALSSSRHLDSLKQSELEKLIETYALVESANYQGEQVPKLVQISALTADPIVAKEYRSEAVRLSQVPYVRVGELAGEAFALLVTTKSGRWGRGSAND